MIGLLVRYDSWSFPLHLVGRLPLPTFGTEEEFAAVAVFSVCTICLTIIAELIARVLPAYTLALGLEISGERTLEDLL